MDATAVKTRGGRRFMAKGRPLDETALTEVVTKVGQATPPRDRLIECLHGLQDGFGHLSARHLRALADHMRLSQAEVFEVASFYHHFDVVKEGGTAPPPVTVRVCDSIACALKGAGPLADTLEADAPAGVRVVRVPCIGRCDAAPAARIGDREVDHASPSGIAQILKGGDLGALVPAYTDLATYREAGGYAALSKVRTGDIAVPAMIGMLEEAGLRGLGGAGFPLATKWKIVRGQAGPRLMTVNGDEGEPGTFKDRWLLERDPHRMLEGALIAAHAVEADRIYLYMRDEYP
ncbi:MAG: NAD(P)H-dependent oxidoreductase subunit E, partial [Pseudomonadota bacterium]